MRTAAAILLLTGPACAPRGAESPATRESPPVRAADDEPFLRGFPFFTLLSFEQDHDMLFLRCDGGEALRDAADARGGAASLLLPAGMRGLSVNLASLHSGRPFPGPWTLVGAWFRCDRPQRLTVSHAAGGRTMATRTVDLSAGRWTPVLLDIADMRGGELADPGELRFVFDGGLAAQARCDDVVEIDNAAVHVETGGDSPWSVTSAGFRYFMERSGAFRVVLKTPQAAAGGWTLAEANAIRAVFVADGPEKKRIVYSDGRQFIDGRFEPLGPARSVFLRQHERPAEVHVEADSGRLLRNEAGDGDNDGYVETEGVWRVAAAGPRVQLSVVPRTDELVNAVLEIVNLPAGRTIGTMEGRLINRIVRLDGGRALVELTGSLRRTTAVVVRVERGP